MNPRRRDADAFEDALAGRSLAHGETAKLMRTVAKVKNSGTNPSDRFREELRTDLMSQASDILVPDPVAMARAASRPRRSPHSMRRRLAGLTVAGATSLATIGVVTSSAQALPGDSLYQVKAGVEKIQLALKDDGSDRGTYQLRRAVERLDEAQAVATGDAAEPELPKLLDEFTTQSKEGSSELLRSYRRTGDKQVIETLQDFTSQASDLISALPAEQFPSAYTQARDSAIQTLTRLVREVDALCPDCDDVSLDNLVRSVAAEKRSLAPESRSDRSVGEAPDADKKDQKDQRDKSEKRDGAQGPAPRSPLPTPAPGVVPSPGPGDRQPSPEKGPAEEPEAEPTPPLLGLLLGDEERPGLVPGLLGGR